MGCNPWGRTESDTTSDSAAAAAVRKGLPWRLSSKYPVPTQAQSLGRKDPLEKEASHPSVLAWEIPWTEEPVRLQSTGSRRNSRQLSD